MSLYHALFEYDVEHILYETGVLLKKGETDELENAWITVVCKIAEHVMGMEGQLFLDVLKSLAKVLQQPQLMIRDAFLLSVKVSFLLRRVSCHARDKLSVHKLRDKVKTLFPEKAALSSDGLKTFAAVLPPPDKVEEYQFAQRIIAGLSKLWTEGKYEESRNCMEYLSRKKIEVDVQDHGDMASFLWGVVHAFFKGDENVATTYKVFCWNQTQKHRKERMGLLWGFFYWVQVPLENVATLSWRDDEERVLDKIGEKYKELWSQLQEEEEPPKETSKIDVLYAFEPRGTVQEVYHEPYQDQRKNIELKKSKMDAMGMGTSKQVKEKSAHISKSHRNETHHLDPRYWRIGTG